jgi:dihydropteroate synthase
MTKLVGIVNLTPDSFSGDGVLTPENALRNIDALVTDGADVIDIGAESTRPGATAISPQEEWARIAPVAKLLGGRAGKVVFSIDTRHAEVAEKALQAGFRWVNDVSGGNTMFALAKKTGCTLVLMHSLSVPANPAKVLPADADAVEEVFRWSEAKLKEVEYAGLSRSWIILDPGIGFGKTARQSMAIITGIARLKQLGVPILVGHSRKSFLSQLTDKPAAERDAQTMELSRTLVAQGIDYLRVHDVKSHAAIL